LHSSQSDPPN